MAVGLRGRFGIHAGVGKKLPLLLCALSAAVLLSGFLLWQNGAFLPRWVIWQNRALSASDRISVVLDGRAVIVKADEREVWRTERGWYVQEALLFDVDRDGAEELVIVCWKHGSYGKHRPTWVKRDTIAFSQHVFIYRLTHDGVQPVWMSSALDMQVSSCMADDKNRLVITAPDGTDTRWGWLDWGLSRME